MNDPAALVARMLAECQRRGASDIHLAAHLPPYFRTHGQLDAHPDFAPLTATDLAAVADVLLAGRDRTALTTTGAVDGAISATNGTRYRLNIYRSAGNLAIALRRLDDRFRPLSELGLPEALYELSDLPDGLVVVAGPTGSGKSTTLATLLDRINRTRACHVVTIEDPIEYVHRSQRSLVHQRQIGTDASNFNDALVASLRQDPDVILVGEIRDQATIRTAITAAETGHLVFTTVHAGDGAGTIERLVSVFPADEQPGVRRQLALVLRAIVAQHLMRADGPARSERTRVVVSEVLMVTSAVANLIATAKSAQVYSAMESGAAQGMQTLEQDLARLLVAGQITEPTALGVSRNPTGLRERVAFLRSKPRGGR
jgi:twitching motility protein PilT